MHPLAGFVDKGTLGILNVSRMSVASFLARVELWLAAQSPTAELVRGRAAFEPLAEELQITWGSDEQVIACEGAELLKLWCW